MDRTPTATGTVLRPPPDAPARTPLEVTAVYLLSEAGRKASLLAGGDGRATQMVTIPVSRNRLHLVTVDPRGKARLKLRPTYDLDSQRQRVIRTDAPPEYDVLPSAEQLLSDASRFHELGRRFADERAAAVAQRDAAERELKTQLATQFLADQSRRAMPYPAPTRKRCRLPLPGSRRVVPFDTSTDSGDLFAKVPPEAYRRFRADLQAKRERSQQLRLDQDATHAQKLAQVGEWIMQHGSEDQKARQALGLLPFPEAIEAITSHYLARLDKFPRYRRDGAAVLRAELSVHHEHVRTALGVADLTVESSNATSVTQAQWEQLEEMRALTPTDFVVVLRTHHVSMKTGPRLKTTLFSVLVTGRLGAINVRREYEAAGAPAPSVV